MHAFKAREGFYCTGAFGFNLDMVKGRFSAETCEKANEYVYALADPRKPTDDPGRYFYVGKGRDQRCFFHAAAEVKHTQGKEPDPKLDLIREIKQMTGEAPTVEIIRHGLTMAVAHELEATLIALLKTEGNKKGGHGGMEACLTVAQMEERYVNPLQASEIGAPALLVNLNGDNKHSPPWPQIALGDLDGRVLGLWPVSEKNARRTEYVLGVYRGVVRCVYRTERIEGHTRYERIHQERAVGKPVWKIRFNGERDPYLEDGWTNRRIVDADGKVLTKFPAQRGSVLLGFKL